MATKYPPLGTSIQLSRIFPAPRERVFKAWTDPEELKRWIAPGDDFSTPIVEVDLRVGKSYRIGMKSPDGNLYVAVGTYREIVPPKKLVYTWSWEGGEMGETLVTVEFREQGQSTEIILKHEMFPDEQTRDQHNWGWNGCLGRLEKIM